MRQRPDPGAQVPRSLQRRLLASYFAVILLLLLAFAIAIHLAFVSIIGAQISARLETLLSAGVRSARIGEDGIEVRQDISPSALLARGQGLLWFDAGRRLIAHEGLPFPGNARLATRTRPILNPATGAAVGYVLAVQDLSQTTAEEWSLDEILIVGGLCTLTAGALGSRYLQAGSVAPIQRSYSRLREFSADASHELRGPITAVNSNAEAALRDDAGMRDDDRRRFQAIAIAAKRMQRLTDDLLLLARAEQSIERDLFAVDLRAAIDRAAALYGAAYREHGVRLDVQAAPGITAYGNPDQIERIVANLLENALRHTPAGGSVTVRATQQRAAITVVVADTGSGIDKADQEKIFERFWRAEQSRTASSGTGLGLPIVRALARRHGGEVSVSSKPGEGSEFLVRLPARPPA